MKKPNSVHELATLLESMAHRERLVFPCAKSVEGRFSEAYAVEIYHTELFDSKYNDRNINIKLVDILGKPLKGDNGKPILNKSKYLRLFDGNFMQDLYNILEGDYSSENKAIEVKPLAIA